MSSQFENSDKFIQILDNAVASAQDEFQKNQYTGFLCVTAVTFFEESFKAILLDFAKKKHHVFGNHIESSYRRINGRITLKDIKKDHIPKFGQKYALRFTKKIEEYEKRSLKENATSIMSAYGNLITWRNEFVHGGRIPQNATYDEARRSYELAKSVLVCLEESMVR